MGLMAQPLLAEAAERGILRDFDAWMASEQRRVYALCQRLLQDRDEADSATQDVFLKAYQALKREDAKELDDPARWVTRIAVNTCLDRLRSRKWQFWRRRPSAEDERAIQAGLRPVHLSLHQHRDDDVRLDQHPRRPASEAIEAQGIPGRPAGTRIRGAARPGLFHPPPLADWTSALRSLSFSLPQRLTVPRSPRRAA